MNINGYFIFDGFDTRTLPGVTVVRGETLESPAREFDVREIPGHNGDLLLDNRKYPNTEITYHVMIRENVESTFRQLAGFLLSRTGYCQLSDSWSTSEFYLAYVSQPIVPTVSRGDELGAFEVVFNRKPQRFLVSGETPVTPTAEEQGQYAPRRFTYLVNPTYFSARPQITLKANGVSSNAIKILDMGLFTRVVSDFSDFSLHVVDGTQRMIVLWDGIAQTSTSQLSNWVSNGDVIIIDCEARSVYNQTTGKSINEIAYITNHTNPWTDGTVFYPDFPTLEPILQTSNINTTMMFDGRYATDPSVLPRWWTV